ncbi:MAG: SprT family zinc-dependent metalloprotease [Acidobacteriota bacterium]
MHSENDRSLTIGDLHQRVEHWYRLWEVPEPSTPVAIEFSSRMTRSLGRCFPERNLIRLAASLAKAEPAFVDEVLVHEAAHLAAYSLHGRAIKPHGPEWKRLMSQAGYSTRARVPVERVPAGILGPPRRRGRRREPIAGAMRRLRMRLGRLRRA